MLECLLLSPKSYINNHLLPYNQYFNVSTYLPNHGWSSNTLPKLRVFQSNLPLRHIYENCSLMPQPHRCGLCIGYIDTCFLFFLKILKIALQLIFVIPWFHGDRLILSGPLCSRERLHMFFLDYKLERMKLYIDINVDSKYRHCFFNIITAITLVQEQDGK